MRLGPLAGLLLTVAPMPVSADMISDPTVNGRVVDFARQ
jgi:hypothetical protein